MGRMHPINPYNFAAAGPREDIVFGACRPGHGLAPAGTGLSEWHRFMQDQKIERVCCLLHRKLRLYDDFSGQLASWFGQEKVIITPVPDYEPIPPSTFHDEILPFLLDADEASERVLVHCSAGLGRTGQALVLWLVSARGYELNEAIETVEARGRAPLEAVTLEQLAQHLSY